MRLGFFYGISETDRKTTEMVESQQFLDFYGSLEQTEDLSNQENCLILFKYKL